MRDSADPLRTVAPCPAYAADASDAQVLDVLGPMCLADAVGDPPWPERAAIVAAFRARVADLTPEAVLERYVDPLAVRLLPVGLTAADLHTANFAAVDTWGPREHAAAYVAGHVAAWMDGAFDFDGEPAGA